MKDLVRRAQKARAAGRWADAYEAYKAAFEATDLASSPLAERAELAGELGLCELALRKYREAAEHLTQSLQRRELLPIQLQQRFEVGQVKAAFHVGTLLLAVDPPDAEVLIDGRPVGRASRSYKVFLEPGRHMVRAQAPGREDALQSFSAVAGVEHEMTMQLPRVAVSSAKLGAPSASQESPKALSSVSALGARPPSPWASWPGTLRIGGVAVTTATAAAGAVFLLRAHVIHSDLREGDVVRREHGWTSHTCREASAPAACTGIYGQVKERNLFATLGKVSLATSAVFGVATAASFFTEFALFGSTPPATGIHIVPVTTSERAGVLLHGAW
ncbi:hypothetical protein [Sorangium sp. So ce233]|uniref:hypothetical protein n=1 Tax=Sorangium sp. So ce233 TaxID=3133290 RepID=UPI003F5DA27A